MRSPRATGKGSPTIRKQTSRSIASVAATIDATMSTSVSSDCSPPRVAIGASVSICLGKPCPAPRPGRPSWTPMDSLR